MTKFITFASAKGGVGKTVVSFNVAIALSQFKHDVVYIDANFSVPNVAILIGYHNPPITLNDVMEGKKHISDAMYLHPSKLRIVPLSLSYEHSKRINPEKIHDVVLDLVGSAEFVILDSGSGLGNDVRNVIKASDEVIAITTPELLAVTGTYRTVQLADELGIKVSGAVLNNISGDEYDMSKENIESILEVPVIESIPHDNVVRKAYRQKQPFVYVYPHSKASLAIKRLAARILGQKYEAPLPENKTKLDVFLEKLRK
ncbi:hypothetical protein D6745_05115 [Candidatus Woesearchaeota archaeon]|nr:MAG: hypothetical protein D6745_05115 [Candidatus Woesearchaeota archaeon]